MQKNKISNRLTLLMAQAKLTKIKLRSIADIGTDHGYLPFAMFEDECIESSILCDINKGPLDNAIKTFEGSKYLNHAEFRLGSGIQPLIENEVDLVFIAGMGGGLIQDILARDIDKSKSFPLYILQPMTEQSSLRHWLLENDFEILWDHFIEDANKHYEIIVVSSPNENNKAGTSLYETIRIVGNDLEFGKCILRNQLHDYLEFLKFKEKKHLSILNQIKKNTQTDITEKFNRCEAKLNTIKKIRENL